MIDDPYKNLANAIVVQAAADYRANPKLRELYAFKLAIAEQKLQEATLTNDQQLIKRAQRRKDYFESKVFAVDADQSEIERFFRSEWFQFLTNANGEVILEQIQAEMQK